jgi:hypothetical protein
VSVTLLETLESLLRCIVTHGGLSDEFWFKEFIDFFSALSKVIISYLEGFGPKQNGILWFIWKYMESSEKAIDVVFDHLPISTIVVNYLYSEDIEFFQVSLKLAGVIMQCENREYGENLYKNGFLEGIMAGWNRFCSPDINKEIAWMLGNLVATQSSIITSELVRNKYIMDRLRELIATPGEQVRSMPAIKTEVFVIVRNIVAGYNLHLSYDLMFTHSFMEALLPYLSLDNPSYRHLHMVLQTFDYLFEKERLLEGNGNKDFYRTFERLGGVDRVEEL